MTISKNEFKTIYNHMKSLSNINNQKLIQQASQGKTSKSEINDIITTHSSEKVVKLMRKINNFMIGGADGLSDNLTSSVVPESVVNSTTSEMAVPESVVNSTTSEMANLEVNNVDSIKDSVREIIDKLKTKSDLLKEKEIQLSARETEIKIKEDTLKNLTSNIEKLEKIKEQLISDIGKLTETTKSTSNTSKEIKLDVGELKGGNTESESNFLSEIFI